MDVKAPVFGDLEEAAWDKEAKGDSNNQVDGFAIWFGHL